MRTAAICPTCATYQNAKCIIYNGSNLNNINVAHLSNLEDALGNIDSHVQILSNLSTNTALGTSNTLYPSQNAVKTYVDNKTAPKYKVYTGIISQSGTGAPTEDVVLEDIITTITYSYSDSGLYLINSSAKFTAGKTIVFLSLGYTNNFTGILGWSWDNSSQLSITSVDGSNAPLDDLLDSASIEIRVYN